MEQRFNEFIGTLTKALKTWHPNQDLKIMEECVPICYKTQLAGFSYYKPWYERKEMGIVIKSEFCGKGLGTWGIKAIEERARMNGEKELIAKVFIENKPMIHLMNKLQWTQANHIITEKCKIIPNDYNIYLKTL